MTTYDMQVKQGGECLINVVFRDGSGQPIDLSAAVGAKLGLRDRWDTGTHAFLEDMTIVSASAPVDDPDRGRLQRKLTGAETAALGPGEYELEVIIDWGDSSPSIAPGDGYRLLRILDAVTT